MKNEKVYLEQILESVDKIADFTKGLNQEKFIADQKTQSAVIMQLALIGELSKKVSETTKSEISIPWKDIAGFRDRAIHDYYQIDLDIVWNTVESDLGILEKAIKEYLEH